MLTLIIIPVIYTYTDAFAAWVRGRLLWIVHREKTVEDSVCTPEPGES